MVVVTCRARPMKRSFLTCGLLALAVMPVGAGGQLKMAVSPAHSFPATFSLEMRDLPAGDYRVVGIMKDGAGHERSLAYQDVKVLGFGIGG